jgi:uncharacterized protein (DUF1015 family)
VSEIRPFRGLRYARNIEPRLAGPYDVISAKERAVLASEPENVVHLTLPPGAEGARDYAAAASTLEDWIASGVLKRDPEPCLYVLEEQTPWGSRRRGVLALLRLADFEARVVLPHEFTMPGPKQDRLLLTREVRANLEPLFFTYEDRGADLDKYFDDAQQGAVLASGTGPDGTGLRLFALSDPVAIAGVQNFLASLPVIIADGHHRYETMLNFRNERRDAGDNDADASHEFVLAYLVNAFDPGTEIRAIHRVLNGDVAAFEPILRSAGFALESLDAGLDGNTMITLLAERAAASHAFVFANQRQGAVLAHKPRTDPLDVELLHEELLPALGGDLSFDAQPVRLLETARSGEIALGIAMNPITPADLFRVVQAGARLPKKSTFFTPKIPSGLVIRDF